MHRGMCSPVNSTLSVLVGDSTPGDILVSWHSHPNSRVTKKQAKVIKTKQNILVTHSHFTYWAVAPYVFFALFLSL